MRIRLFNVKYSPNLGDGLLSECLEEALAACGADAGTRSVDLSARTGYAAGSTSRSRLLAVLERMPAPLRRRAVRVPLALMCARRWRPHFVAAVKDADAVVIGGGNLFTDMDLNFPTKIAAALDVAAARGLPVAIYGVGVGAAWSAAGLAMVRHALGRSRLVHVSVRDDASAERFRRHFGDLAPHPAVVRDPGLLASRFLGPAEAASGAVGLCVTSAVAVRYHSSLETSDEDLASFYTGLAERLRAAGRSLVAFTNGSPEDEAFLDALAPRLSGGGVTRRRVRTPAELARMIGSFDALVAHRMHALIAGHSFGVPIHALAWDCKVDAFMASVGAAAPTVADGASVEAVAARVLEPAAQAAPSAAVEEAAQHVARLFAALSASGNRRPKPAAGAATAVAP